MNEHQHHEELVSGFYKVQKEIFDSSSQAIYAYLDDNHKVCNQKFASLLGYSTPNEWSKIQDKFLEAFVAPKSQEVLANSYKKAMERTVGSQIRVTLKKKTGETVDTKVILVPVMYDEHLFALHFVSKDK